MSDLTQDQQEKLFVEVSNAMKSDDGVKLNELLTAEVSGEETPVETPAEEEEEVVETTTPDDDQPDDKTDKEDKSPSKKTDEEEEPKDEKKTIAELQAQLEKTQHALRSQVGRIPEIQRRLALIDKKLGALDASPSSQASTKIKPKVEELLKDVKDTDPILADAVANAVAAAIGGADEGAREQQRADLIEERKQLLSDHQQEQIARLTSMYPNASDVFASPHWAAWKKEQPQHILNLAESDSADAVAFAFKLYADDMRAKYPELGKNVPPQQDKETDPNAAEKARQLEEERNRRKKSDPSLDTTKTGKRVQEPTDPEALFEHFSKQIREGKMG